MSGYRRLISYLYSYNSGLKTKNVGFAKVERRGDVIKILVNLKGAYSEEEEYDVCFFIRQDDWQLGISLGKITIRNGNGDFRRVLGEDELRCNFDDVCGIYIAGENVSKIFASGWDDKTFDVKRIRPYEKSEERVKTEAGSRTESDTEADTHNAVRVEAVRTETALPEDALSEAAPSETVLTGDDPAEVKITPVWEKPIKEEIYVMQEMASAPIEPEKGAVDWEKLFAPLEDRRVFCDDEIYDCTDISLDELSKLPEDISAYANNSFVNHAFYNFHHLLIAKFVERGDKKGLFFGVPGVYDRRERVIAGMFGFDKFKFSMRSDVNLLHFGYWYKEY